MPENVIGIDLGTSFSCVSVVIDDAPVVIPDQEGNLTMPSVVAFGAEAQRLVGWKAKRQMVYNPINTVYEAKRLIGRKIFAEALYGQNFPARKAGWPQRLDLHHIHTEAC